MSNSPRACRASGTIPSPALSAIDSQGDDLQTRYDNAGLDAAIGDLDRDITRLQESPDRMQAALGQLSLDRHILCAERNRRHNSQALIMRLPVELLARIFCLARRTWREVRRFDPTPFIVSRVCSLWRAVALSTALLWSKIAIEDDPTDYLPLCLGMVQHMLDHSGNAPLAIEVECLRGSGELPARDALVAESPRWEHATFRRMSNIMDVLRPISGRLKSLRTLRLISDLEHDYLHRCDIFSDAPVLEEVLLFGFPPNMLALPWGQLRHLKLDTISIESTLDALALCNAVERLEWNVFITQSPSGNAVSSVSPVVLPRLTSLRVTVTSLPSPPLSPLVHLTTPLLETLLLGDLCDYHTISTFLMRSRCHLRELNLLYTSMRPMAILELLKSMPLLSKLFISDITYSLECWCTLLNELARQAASLIPGLVEFGIVKYNWNDEEDIIAMVEARLPAAGGTLRRLTVSLTRNAGPVDKLEGLRDSWTERGLVSTYLERDVNEW